MTMPANARVPGARRAPQGLDIQVLRRAIQDEYAMVAADPDHGFHFHTGRRLARILGYEEGWLAGVPEDTIASFAGTGNPFALGALAPGERVVDVGCGAGIDSLIAAHMVAPDGEVIGVCNMKIPFGEGLGFAIPARYLRDFIRNRDSFAYDKDNPNSGYSYNQAPARSEFSPPTELDDASSAR